MSNFKVIEVDPDFDDNNNGYQWGVELWENGECVNVEWYKTEQEQHAEFLELKKIYA